MEKYVTNTREYKNPVELSYINVALACDRTIPAHFIDHAIPSEDKLVLRPEPKANWHLLIPILHTIDRDPELKKLFISGMSKHPRLKDIDGFESRDKGFCFFSEGAGQLYWLDSLLEWEEDALVKEVWLMALAVAPPEGKVIVIREPEAGIHPDFLGIVMEHIQEKRDKKAIYFFTTFSYFMLDLLYPKEDEAIKVLTWDRSDDQWDEPEVREFHHPLENALGVEWASGKLGACYY